MTEKAEHQKAREKKILVWPDPALAAVVGDNALTPDDLRKKVWQYCKDKKLIEEK